MKLLILVIIIPLFALLTNMADALDFCGASLTLKDVSMRAWKTGINGNYPITNFVSDNSPAAKAGLKQGDILLSINDNTVKNTSDFDKFSTKDLKVIVLRDLIREKITIDRCVVEAEKMRLTSEERKPVVDLTASRTNTSVDQVLYNSSPIILNDSVLEKKFGKATPVELTRQDKIAEIYRLEYQIRDQYKEYCRLLKKDIELLYAGTESFYKLNSLANSISPSSDYERNNVNYQTKENINKINTKLQEYKIKCSGY